MLLQNCKGEFGAVTRLRIGLWRDHSFILGGRK